ncbi:ZIP family metal transporter [Candidatus Woesearchaeota archaeon]|nr:ZIP family metal transporter [Candidatus Woesearchaeota archaeon]
MNPILIIILISIAGPLIGSFIGIMRKPSERMMYNLLSFAAGVMLAVSFLELIPEAIELSSIWVCVIGIIIGSLVMFGLDRLIPHIHPGLCKQEHGHRLGKTAAYLLWGIFLHNFPEGLAMGVGSVTTIKLSYIIAIAIAIHDIPEGVCTSAPFYYITKKRLKSFLISFSTAIPTIAGFLLSYFLFPVIHQTLVGILVAATAGLMIYISTDELIPTSCCKMTNHSTIFSLMAGVLSVVLLGLL